jgi:flagellar protein FliS
MSINAYEQNRILSASPVELVRILHTAAVDSVSDALYHIRSGDISSRSRAINKTQMILVELASSLDRTQNHAFPERLLALYDYMLTRLSNANVDQDEAPLMEVGRLLSTLQEGWAAPAVSEELEPVLAAR